MVRSHNIPALVQIMAWRRPGDKPLSEPMMVSLLTHICVIRPQRVSSVVSYRTSCKLKIWFISTLSFTVQYYATWCHIGQCYTRMRSSHLAACCIQYHSWLHSICIKPCNANYPWSHLVAQSAEQTEEELRQLGRGTQVATRMVNSSPLSKMVAKLQTIS